MAKTKSREKFLSWIMSKLKSFKFVNNNSNILIVGIVIVAWCLPEANASLKDTYGKIYDYIADTSCTAFMSECCRHPFIRTDTAVERLKEVLRTEFFGQHIASETVLTALDAHLSDDNPSKPLVLSFHGWAGSGKTYLAELIINALYQRGADSKYVRLYTASYDFPDETKIKEYKERIQKEITQTLSYCERSVILFDEVDITPPTLFDALVAFLDRMSSIKGLSHKKAIYIFLSNIGSNEITATSVSAWKEGKRREELTFHDFEDAISKEAFNAKKSGLSKTRIIERVLVDYFIPFLPMERQHVIDCVKVEIKRQGITIDHELVADSLTYWPPDLKLYSQTGCKRVEGLVKYHISRNRLKDEL